MTNRPADIHEAAETSSGVASLSHASTDKAVSVATGGGRE